MKTIGVLGLGIIGTIWSQHYETAGVLAGTWNRTPQPGAPRWRHSAEDVAAAADAVQIVVADPPAVRGLVDRLLPLLRPGQLVIQSSTIDPASSTAFRDRVAQTGARYLEAPFTGSKPAAEQRQTVFYLGGDAADAVAAEPLLSLVSATRLHIGTPAQAATLKLAMNLNLAAQMQAISEALVLSRRAGISDDRFFAGLACNAGSSGLTRLKEPKLRAGDFTPQFSVKHMAKDLRLAAATAGAHPMPVLETVRSCLDAAERAGHGDDDFSSVIRLLAARA